MIFIFFFLCFAKLRGFIVFGCLLITRFGLLGFFVLYIFKSIVMIILFLIISPSESNIKTIILTIRLV